MISAKQATNILNKSLASNNGFIEPTLSLSVSPNNYTTGGPITGNVIITGAITLNQATAMSWVVKENGTTVSSGVSLSVNVSRPKPVLITTYELEIFYTGGLTTKSTFTYVIVTEAAYYGQLPAPGNNIIVDTDLDSFLPGLSFNNQVFVGNLFSMTLLNTGRIVFVSPDSYGPVIDIVDENDTSVLNEFNVIYYTANSQTIYVKINTVVAGTYQYKLQY